MQSVEPHLQEGRISTGYQRRGLGTEPRYPEVSFVVQCLLFLYVGTFFLQAGYRIELLGTVRFEFLVAGTLVAIALLRITQHKHPSAGISALVTLFIVAFAIQVLFSVDREWSYTVFVDRVLKFGAMGLVIATFCVSPRVLKVFIAAFLLSCFKMGQEGLVGNLTGNMVWENQGVMRLHGSTPLYLHPNSFAGMAVGVLPFIYFLFPVLGKYGKVFLIVLLVFAINIVVFSGSRTAYVGAFAFVAFLVWQSRHRVRFLMAAILVGMAAVQYVPEQYVERFESIFTGKEKEGASSEARLEILGDAVEIFLDNPLGVGVSAFPAARQAKFGRSQDTHNLYLEVATNLGVQGLVIFVLLFGKIALMLRKLHRELQSQRDRLKSGIAELSANRAGVVVEHEKNLEFLAAICSATIGYLVVRLFLGLFGHDLYEVYWWVIIGLACALFRINVVARSKTNHLLSKVAAT